MSKFIKDLFTEFKVDNKVSSKKFMGILVGLLAAIGSILEGLHFYDVNPSILDSMWFYSGAMLGASVVRHFSKNSNINEEK